MKIRIPPSRERCTTLPFARPSVAHTLDAMGLKDCLERIGEERVSVVDQIPGTAAYLHEFVGRFQRQLSGQHEVGNAGGGNMGRRRESSAKGPAPPPSGRTVYAPTPRSTSLGRYSCRCEVNASCTTPCFHKDLGIFHLP